MKELFEELRLRFAFRDGKEAEAQALIAEAIEKAKAEAIEKAKAEAIAEYVASIPQGPPDAPPADPTPQPTIAVDPVPAPDITAAN